jgi:hypothetical protein
MIIIVNTLQLSKERVENNHINVSLLLHSINVGMIAIILWRLTKFYSAVTSTVEINIYKKATNKALEDKEYKNKL